MTDEEKVKVNWVHFAIGFVLLVGIITPSVIWLSKFLWSHAMVGWLDPLRGLW